MDENELEGWFVETTPIEINVMEGKFGSTIVKATYGTETRKWRLNSHGSSKHSDLVHEVRNEFGIEAENVHLKYKDSDGDFIELSSDEDLELAVEVEKNLVIVVSNDSESLPASLNEFRSSLTTLISDATRLFNSLDTLSFPEKKTNPVSTRDAVSSPVKTEPVATIDPSVLEEVQLNDAPSNGTIHEAKPPTYDNGIQSSFPIKNSQSDGPTGYSSQPLPPLNHAQPPTPAPLPPPSNYGQSQQQFQPSGYGQQQTNYLSQPQPPSSFNPNQQPAQLNTSQQRPQATPTGPPSMAPPLQAPPSSQPPSFHSAQPPSAPPTSNQPPTSMPLPPPTSNYGQTQYQPQQQYQTQQQFQPPTSVYGQQPQQTYLPQPPTSFNPGQQSQAANPFQRPSMTPTQLPPSSMPLPPSSYGQQQQHY